MTNTPLQTGATSATRNEATEADLRNKIRESNLTFLVDLNRDFARLSTVDQILESVGSKIAEHLNISSYVFAEVNDAEDEVTVQGAWRSGAVADISGKHRISDFISGQSRDSVRNGEPIVVCDTQSDSLHYAEKLAALKILAHVTVPFHHKGEWKYLFSVGSPVPRHWNPDEIELIKEVTLRTFFRLERARMEEALRRSEERFRRLIEVSSQIVWVTNAQGEPIEDSPSWCAFTGRSPEQWGGWRWIDAIHPEDRKLVSESWRNAVAAASPYHIEIRMIHHTGEYRHVACQAVPVLNPDGRVREWIGMIVDITERKQAEESLRQSRMRLIEAQRLTKLGDWEWDPSQDHVIWSPGMYDVFDRSRELPPPAGREGLSRYYTPESWARLEEAIAKAQLTGEPYELELEHIRDDNSHHWHLSHGEAVRDSMERVIKLRGTAQDITERKQARDELQRLNSELERLVDQRTGEITELADQLRELASELTLTEQRERQRIAKILHDHIQQMLVAAKLQAAALINWQQNEHLKTSVRLVTEMIDQTIAASRNLTAELSPPVLYEAGLGPALQSLARTFLEKHRLAVEVAFDPSGEPGVEDVRVFLFDAIREALFNVVKHSGVQSAHVKCSRGTDDRVHVIISDEGKGFDPVRLQSGKRSDGYGLFSIQQRLKHRGGRFEIDSAPGEGTRITLITPPCSAAKQLPLASMRQSPPVVPKEELRAAKIRVMLADDHHIIRQGLAGLLSSEPDIEIIGEASNGAQAVNLARSLHPNIIVMDISMPVLNGVEATREICRDFPDIKVIGLSMHEEGELSSAIRQAGAVAYVTKGGAPQALIQAIRKSAGQTARP